MAVARTDSSGLAFSLPTPSSIREFVEAGSEVEFHRAATPQHGSARPTDIDKALAQARGPRHAQSKITVGEATAAPAAAAAIAAAVQGGEDDHAQRALANPEVQKFQELFPGSEVRDVRDLKE